MEMPTGATMLDAPQLATEPLDGPAECDRCVARARMRVVFLDGRDLVFCGHHGMEAQLKLDPNRVLAVTLV